MIQAALFDFDGVVADTFSYHFNAWKEILKSEGIQPYPESILLNEGSGAAKIALAIARDCGLEIPESKAKEWARRKNLLFRKNHAAQVFKEIPEIIAMAKKSGLKTGLVTGTSIENIKSVVPENVFGEFDVIVTDADSSRGKPFPDPYLTAAKKLDVAIKDCLVIENAPLGIRSAKAAGAFCVALMTTLSEEHLREADVTYGNHLELKAGLLELLQISN